MVRTKATTKQSVPKPKRTRKPKSQIRKNKETGSNFENVMLQYFTEYLRSKEIEGWVLKLPDGRNCDQMIDIIIDSQSFGYCGCECKSISESRLTKEKIYLNELSRHSADYGHQFRKQHMFLKAASRYGILAIEFRDMKVKVLVPHQYIYQKIEEGATYVTVTEILKDCYRVDDGRGSLKLFIRNKCQVYD